MLYSFIFQSTLLSNNRQQLILEIFLENVYKNADTDDIILKTIGGFIGKFNINKISKTKCNIPCYLHIIET